MSYPTHGCHGSVLVFDGPSSNLQATQALFSEADRLPGPYGSLATRLGMRAHRDPLERLPKLVGCGRSARMHLRRRCAEEVLVERSDRNHVGSVPDEGR